MTDLDSNDNTATGLRRAAEKGRAAMREAAALRRENAMLRSGIPVDSPIGQMFNNSYGGEITLEAIREGWQVLTQSALEAVGVPTTAPGVPSRADDDFDDGSTLARQQLASGAAPDTPPPPAHPNLVASRQAEELRRDGASQEAIETNFVDVHFRAAAAGDKRVLGRGSR